MPSNCTYIQSGLFGIGPHCTVLFEVFHRPTVMLGSRFAVSRGSLTRTFCAAAEPAQVRASRRLKDNRPLLIQQRAKNADLEASQKASGLEWRVLSAT